jgi:hypothetical protein
LVALFVPRVVVVAPVEGDVALSPVLWSKGGIDEKLPVRWGGGIKPRLAEAGRAMALRTRPLAERLAEPWEGVKYTLVDATVWYQPHDLYLRNTAERRYVSLGFWVISPVSDS